MPAQSKYPLELRQRAVAMHREGEPKPVIRQMARQLGVHPEALRNWIRQDQADASERKDVLSTAQRTELVALRRENAELQRANESPRGCSTCSSSAWCCCSPIWSTSACGHRAAAPGARIGESAAPDLVAVRRWSPCVAQRAPFATMAVGSHEGHVRRSASLCSEHLGRSHGCDGQSRPTAT